MRRADYQSYPCPEGTVYATLLNFRCERALWAKRSEAAPYLAPAQAPVLCIKTANTFNPIGGVVALPHGVPALEVGASLGLIMGDDTQAHALAVFNGGFVSHDSYYRPPLRFKNGDRWLGAGAQRLALNDWSQLSDLSLPVFINDRVAQTVDCSGLYRDAARLVEDVTAFTAWRTGEVLLLGLDCLPDGTRPLVHAGDRVRIAAADGLWVEHTVRGRSHEARTRGLGRRDPHSGGAGGTFVAARGRVGWLGRGGVVATFGAHACATPTHDGLVWGGAAPKRRGGRNRPSGRCSGRPRDWRGMAGQQARPLGGVLGGGSQGHGGLLHPTGGHRREGAIGGR